LESAAWHTYLQVLSRAPSASERLPDSLVRTWTAEVGRAATGAIALGDSVIAVQSSNRVLSLLHRASGEFIWRARIGGPGAGGPVFDGRLVFTASADQRGHVYAYDLYGGRRRWAGRVGPVAGTPALAPRYVIATTAGGWLYALDRESGRVAWTRNFHQPIRTGVTPVGANLLVFAEDSLFLVSGDGMRVIARGALGDAVIHPPAVNGALVVTASPDGAVVAYDAATLAERWRRPLGAAVFGSPAVARDTVFVTTIAGGLWRIPIADPAGAWAQEVGAPIRAAPAPIADGVIVGTITGELVRIRGADPSRWWRDTVRGPIEEPAIVSGGALYVVDGRGMIVCYAAPEGA
jgi:outer membrane protein assembly factor BamB